MKLELLVLGCLLGIATPAFAASSPQPRATQASPQALSESERRTVAGRLLLKWGDYVERVNGQEREAWAARLWPALARADLDNLRKASRAVTYEGMRNALLGQRPYDDQVIDAIAKAGPSSGKALGQAAADLVFTPITPCRIVDTRVNNDRLTAGVTRTLRASNPAGNFVDQGGSSTNCGIPDNPAALALSVTALNNASTGYLRVFPANGTSAQGSPVSMAAVNTTVNNDILVAACQDCTSDLKVFSTANTHYAAFVTGYFMAPQASAWECVQAQSEVVIIPVGAESSLDVAVCPATYTRVARNVSSGNVVVQTATRGFVHALNMSQYPAWTVEVATCCRVPGR